MTVFSKDSVPLAERIIYYEPPVKIPSVEIKLNSTNSKYSVGDKVQMDLTFSSEENNKKSEILYGVSVVDESVLEMVSKRKQVPRLPVIVYLENEVNSLDDAKIYLDRTDPNSKLALDLLLGTQGCKKKN